MARKPSPPKCRKQQRPNGRIDAFVEIDRHGTYLGPHGTPESREAYGRLIAELQASGG